MSIRSTTPNSDDEIEVVLAEIRGHGRIRIRESRGHLGAHNKSSIFLTPDQLDQHAKECASLAAAIRHAEVIRKDREATPVPPFEVVREAVAIANRSTCAKSKRGVVIYGARLGGVNPYRNSLLPGYQFVGTGFNGPPTLAPICDRSSACRQSCPKLAVHAEERAQRAVLEQMADQYHIPHPLYLMHVKVGSTGELVAGGPPSCITCSRSLLDARIVAKVWLYEAKEIPTCNATYLAGHGDYEYCGAKASVASTDGRFTCESCANHVDPAQHTAANLEAILNDGATWRFYTVEEFHRRTCENAGVYHPKIEATP